MAFAPDNIKGYPPVKYSRVARKVVKEFKAILDSAEDEKPLQVFFEKNPAVLLTGILSPHTAFVIPRSPLPKPEGGCWIPDFMLCDWTSIGPLWTIVELESPTARTHTLKGALSAKLRTAQQQIEDYRQHLRKHAAFLRDGGWPDIHLKANAWIVIGRARATTLQERERLVAFREYDIEIASYDRLLYGCNERISMEHGWRRGLRGWSKKHAPSRKVKT